MEHFFDSWFSVIHQLQPGAVIFSDAGPDTRWIGDEGGIAVTTCWSVFNRCDVKIGGADPKYSQRGDPAGHWVPAECDVLIRRGWFWHPTELPKSPLTLLNLYFKSFGRNCLLLLNVPPNSSGLISEQDVRVLRDYHRLRRSIFSNNLARGALLSASSTRGGLFGPQNVLQKGMYSYWAPKENQTDWVLCLDFQEPVSFNVLQVQEPIHMGQTVIGFHVEVLNGDGGEWRRVVNGTTIGYKRLLQFQTVSALHLRVLIYKSRADRLISYLGIYVNNYIIPGDFDSDNNGFGRRENGTQILLRQVTSGHFSFFHCVVQCKWF